MDSVVQQKPFNFMVPLPFHGAEGKTVQYFWVPQQDSFEWQHNREAGGGEAQISKRMETKVSVESFCVGTRGNWKGRD